MKGNRSPRRGPDPVQELNPVKGQRKRRGPTPKCLCDLPACVYCRKRAAALRYYLRNRELVNAKNQARMPAFRAKLKALRDATSDDEMDRKALAMLQREGIRA
jgi:hypothetical protein